MTEDYFIDLDSEVSFKYKGPRDFDSGLIENKELKYKKLTQNAKAPTRNNPGDAGLDFYSDIEISIPAHGFVLIPTGIAVELPVGTVGLLWDRSGLGSKGIEKFAGVIDSTYRGEIKVILFNNNDTSFEVKRGDKIIQMLIQEYLEPVLREVEELSSSARNEKGFGSSG